MWRIFCIWYGSVLPRTVPSSLCYALMAVIYEGSGVAGDDSALIGNPYALQILAAVLGWILVQRSNLAYNRWWEARTAIETMEARWAHAAMHIIMFDHPSKLDDGEYFRARIVHLFSMLHAVCMADLRMDWRFVEPTQTILSQCPYGLSYDTDGELRHLNKGDSPPPSVSPCRRPKRLSAESVTALTNSPNPRSVGARRLRKATCGRGVLFSSQTLGGIPEPAAGTNDQGKRTSGTGPRAGASTQVVRPVPTVSPPPSPPRPASVAPAVPARLPPADATAASAPSAEAAPAFVPPLPLSRIGTAHTPGATEGEAGSVASTPGAQAPVQAVLPSQQPGIYGSGAPPAACESTGSLSEAEAPPLPETPKQRQLPELPITLDRRRSSGVPSTSMRKAQEESGLSPLRFALTAMFYVWDPQAFKEQALSNAFSVIGGLSRAERRALASTHSRDRPFLVQSWIVMLMVQRVEQGGMPVGAPIISRTYQLMGDGHNGFCQAAKIANTPFPFPYVQLISLMLHVFNLLSPLFVASMIDRLNETGITSATVIALITFCVTLGYSSLNQVARELEEPYGHGPNHLPLVLLQQGWNERIIHLLLHDASRSVPDDPLLGGGISQLSEDEKRRRRDNFGRATARALARKTMDTVELGKLQRDLNMLSGHSFRMMPHRNRTFVKAT